MPPKKVNPVKTKLHPRNKNRERYDLKALVNVKPELNDHIVTNRYGVETVDFANRAAVKLLNQALLHHYYGIESWEFPNENLCPPIPGRADYLHHVADILTENNSGILPLGDKITCLDIGLGASCIYPVLGVTEYGWYFIGSDIDSKSMASAQHIVNVNPSLSGKIECRLQTNPENVFVGVLGKDEKIDVTLCNPPFHTSKEDAQKGTRRKIKNLSGKNVKTPKLNFAGIDHELIFEGGEYAFINNMIRESEKFSKNCFWFSTLVSKQSNLKRIYKVLAEMDTTEIKEIAMGTGNKSSRIIAWSFLSSDRRKEWRETRW